MAAFTLAPHARFPVGTTVGAYPVPGNARLAQTAPDDAPMVGTPTATANVASDGTTALTGLADETLYIAAAQVGGVWRRCYFRTPPSTATLNARMPTWRARRRALGLAG